MNGAFQEEVEAIRARKREAETGATPRARVQDSQEKIRQPEQCMEKMENRLKQRTHELHRADALIGDLNREKQRLERKSFSDYAGRGCFP